MHFDSSTLTPHAPWRIRDIGQIELREACCAMREVRIEYVVARLIAERARQTMLVAIRREFFVERERAGRDPSFDAPQLRAGALEIRFSRCCRDRRPIARSSIVEVELYSARPLRADSSTCEPRKCGLPRGSHKAMRCRCGQLRAFARASGRDGSLPHATSRSYARLGGQIRSLISRNGRSMVSQSNAPAAMQVAK